MNVPHMKEYRIDLKRDANPLYLMKTARLYILICILIAVAVSQKWPVDRAKCPDTQVDRPPDDDCNTWHMYVLLLLHPEATTTGCYENIVYVLEDLMAYCKKNEQNSRNHTEPQNFITYFTLDGYYETHPMLHSQLERWDVWEHSLTQRNLNVSIITLAADVINSTNITTVDAEALFVVTNIPCQESLTDFPPIFDVLSQKDVVGVFAESSGIPLRILWYSAETPNQFRLCQLDQLVDVPYIEYMQFHDPWHYNTSLLSKWGMCPSSATSVPQFPISFPAPPTTTTIAAEASPEPVVKSRHHRLLPLWISIGVGAVILIIGIIALLTRRYKINEKKVVRGLETQMSVESNKYFPYADAVENANSWEIDPKQLRLSDEKLGSGAFADVFRGVLKGQAPVFRNITSILSASQFNGDSMEVAVKAPRAHASQAERLELLREISFMQTLGYHPHILSLLGCSQNKMFPLILTELCEKGDLLTLLHQSDQGKEGFLVVDDFLPIAWQLCDALEFLSSKNIVHRDVAARNVLVKSNKEIKLGDFGLCRHYEEMFYTSKGGKLPVKWMAPESIEKFTFSTKSDVWSFGVFLYELYSFGSTPFPGLLMTEVLAYMKEGKRMEKPVQAPDKIYSLQEQCWQEDPHTRPSFSELALHLYEMLEESSLNYGYLKTSIENA